VSTVSTLSTGLAGFVDGMDAVDDMDFQDVCTLRAYWAADLCLLAEFRLDRCQPQRYGARLRE
jgi:hypothetical protein